LPRARLDFRDMETATASSSPFLEEHDSEALVRALLVRAGDDRVPGATTSSDTLHVAGESVVVDVVVDGFRCVVISPKPLPPPEHVLSPREREIARMVADGYPNKTIAAVLGISSWTVSTYLRRVFAKLDVRSRAAMVARVVEEGLVEPPEPPTINPRR
jgi:DNA-binding CsgD family transcriptional regulator